MKSFLIPLAFVCGLLVKDIGANVVPCDSSRWNNDGEYHAAHATCCKYYDCERQTDTSDWISHVRQCPAGLFWNDDDHTCDWPTDVSCAQDPCTSQADDTKVADGCYCYGYFICQNGLSHTHETCADGFRFNGATCVADSTCTHPVVPPPPSGCTDMAAHSTDPTKYVWTVHGTPHVMSCPTATVWSQAQCTCDHDASP